MTSISPSLWLAQEQLRLRTESPRFWALLQQATRFRVPLLVLVAAISGGFMQVQSLSVADTTWFVQASHQLFSRDALDVFRDPALQVGPLYLAMLGLMGFVADGVRVSPAFVDGFLQAGLVCWLCVQLVRALAPGDGLRTVRDLGIGVSLIFGPLAGVGVAGHFEEPLVATFLLLAALRASQGRDVSAALLLVLASGFKLSGLLGVPILLIAPSWPALVRRGLVFGAAFAAVYLPFFLWGTVNTFHFSWPVWPSATMGWFVPGHPFSWQLRMLQGGLAVLAAAAIALRRSAPVWACPTMLIAVRLLLDPEQVPYYWVALVLCLVVAVWSSVERRLAAAWLVTTVGALVTLSMPYWSGDRTTRVLHTLALAGVLFVVVRAAVRRPGPVG